MIAAYRLPRNSLMWMLLAQSVVMAPFAFYLPWFLVLAWLLVIIWRLQIYRGVWQLPSNAIKALLIASIAVGLWWYYRRFYGLEPMVSLLLGACLLKLLEVRSYREQVLVIFLGYLLVAMQFLFSQSILAGCNALIAVWLVTVALQSVHQPVGHNYPQRSLLLAGRLLLHALPLMLLMFVVMPRLGSFWAVPNLQHAAKTGVSDTMAPGDITRLTRSADVAFRVTFNGAAPAVAQLYWRGLVLSAFDGRQWRQAEAKDYLDGPMVDWLMDGQRAEWLSRIHYGVKRLDYSVIMEPTQQRWIYSLAAAEPRAPSQLGLTRDFRLISAEPIHQRLAYQVSSYLDYQFEVDPLPAWRKQHELQLPHGYNPQTLERAQQWFAESGSEQAYIKRVLAYFAATFTYTLEPPALGMHSVDDFLWGSQRGFCEHFASSFVVLMRAAGIPARVVTGYQGGEFNQPDNYLIVRQYDAHAWAEVWLSGQGWVQIDPTAAVSPARVESGINSALTPLEAATLNPWQHFALLDHLQLQWDAINYSWQRSVLGYDSQRQTNLLIGWLGQLTPQRMLVLVMAGGGLFLGGAALHLYWRRRSPPCPPELRSYRQFTRKLARRGLMRQSGEAPRAYLQRLQLSPLMRDKPALYIEASAITSLFEQVYYQDRRALLEQLRIAVRTFSP